MRAVKTRIRFSINRELIGEIDRRRGMAKRSTYAEYLLRLGLSSKRRSCQGWRRQKAMLSSEEFQKMVEFLKKLDESLNIA